MENVKMLFPVRFGTIDSLILEAYKLSTVFYLGPVFYTGPSKFWKQILQ